MSKNNNLEELKIIFWDLIRQYHDQKMFNLQSRYIKEEELAFKSDNSTNLKLAQRDYEIGKEALQRDVEKTKKKVFELFDELEDDIK